MKYLLDTSVCSQPLKRHPIASVLKRWNALQGSEAATSQACLAEIEWGLHKLGSNRRWEGYRRVVLPSIHAIATDQSVWAEWARMKARQQMLGLNIEDIDLLIAATAVEHHLIVATLNVAHFSKIEGIRWEDWSV